MTCAEAAAARGVTHQAASRWAKRHGIKFATKVVSDEDRARRDKLMPRKTAEDIAAWRRDRMIAINADPEFVARRRERNRAYIERFRSDPDFKEQIANRIRATLLKRQRDPAHNPLALLTEEERADYDILRRKARMRRADALVAIGRADLIQEVR
jgi:hypothetical protein